MPSQRLFITRIPSLRPLRPPWLSSSRSFHKHPGLLVLPRSTLRPQVPYLSSPQVHRGRSPLDRYALRVLSTETQRRAKDAAFTVTKVVVYSAILITLTNIVIWTMTLEYWEHLQPTPAEWHFWTKHSLRSARAEVEAWAAKGYIDWVAAGLHYLDVIRRLEDVNIDGEGLSTQQDDAGTELRVAELGSAGLDVSNKSWQWRQGYFEALMGAAQASENTDDMIRDVPRQLIFPKSTIIGPSNPDPRPVSEKMQAAPLEEDCEQVFPAPETYYVKILTAKGFTTKQKVAAALAYGNWLEYSGLKEAAYEVFRWSIDIAKQPVENDGKLFKHRSFVLEANETARPTENLIHAVTAMGVHQARVGNVDAALPILLAAFKARREAPVAPYLPIKTVINQPGSTIDAIAMIFTQPPVLQEPRNGDAPLQREPSSICEDSELMLYIGELMYASTSKREEGLVWTKQAAEIASREMHKPSVPIYSRAELKSEIRKCKQCLITGVKNWTFMLNDLTEREATAPATTGWFGSTRTTPSLTTFDADRERLEELDAAVFKLQADIDATSMRRSGKFAMFKG